MDIRGNGGACASLRTIQVKVRSRSRAVRPGAGSWCRSGTRRPLYRSALGWTWLPAVHEIAARHGLSGTRCQEALGSHVAFGIGAVIVKLYCSPWGESFQAEEVALAHIGGLPSPQIVGEGDSEGWPYEAVPRQQPEGVLRRSVGSTAAVHRLTRRVQLIPRGGGPCASRRAAGRERGDGSMSERHTFQAVIESAGGGGLLSGFPSTWSRFLAKSA